jgi:predicted metal-dependent phosphotriesterase family hydrolase
MAARKDLHAAISADKNTQAAIRVHPAVERIKLSAETAPILTDAQKKQLAGIE